MSVFVYVAWHTVDVQIVLYICMYVFKLCIFLCNSHAPRGNQLIVDEASV